MRPKLLLEAEIIQAREDFLRHDADLDMAQADLDYQRLDQLLDEYLHIPHQRHA